MAVAFRSSSSVQDQISSTFSVGKPAGATDGDLLVAAQGTKLGGGTAPAAPSGWSTLDRTLYDTNQCDLAVFYKVVAGDGANYTFNGPGGSPVSNLACVYIACWSGADTAPESSTKNTGTGTTATALAVTTAQANEYLLGAYAIGANLGETITPNESQTALGTLGISPSIRMNVGYVAQAAAGGSGNKTATISGSDPWAAMLVAIPPPASPPSTANLVGGGGAAAFAPSPNPFAFRTASRRSGRRR